MDNLQVRTNVIDAIQHDQYRSELRLDPLRVYGSNLRLGNIGSVITGGVDNKAPYNQVSGVASLIQNIYLYDGTTCIDQLFNAHHFLAFKTLQKQNGENYNVSQYLTGVSNSYNIELDSRGNGGVNKGRLCRMPQDNLCLATNDENTTFKGWLSLQRCFDVLNRLPVVDTSVFQNLRVVIEWRQGLEVHSCFQGTVITSATILRPQLFADEFVGSIPKLPSSQSIVFNAYEMDRVNVDAIAANGSFSRNQRLNAFNGKTVSKLLLMKILNDQLTSQTADDGVKCDGSFVYSTEQIQVYVNGNPVFDFMGVDTPARSLNFTCDAWGSLNIPEGSYLPALASKDDMMRPAVKNLVGRLGYTGFMVQSKVSELDIDIKLTNSGADIGAGYVYVWGEVMKAINIQNGAYVISYV